MPDILIKNMNKPKNCVLEEHLSDGSIVKHEVIELPPHGRLVDIDRIIEILEKNSDAGIPRTNAEVACLLRELAKYSTIVEASNGNNN